MLTLQEVFTTYLEIFKFMVAFLKEEEEVAFSSKLECDFSEYHTMGDS